MNITKYLVQANTEEGKLWIQRRVERHCMEHSENVGEIEHIIDWMNSTDAHPRCGRMTYDEARRAAVKWVKKLHKKGHHIKELEGDTETVLTLGDYRVAKLVGEPAFKREGLLMSHCVASYYGRQNVEIYSVRDHLNNPHATIEVTRDQVLQIKGKGNGAIHPEYIHIVLKFLEEVTHLPIRGSEMRNLGYVPLQKIIRKVLKKLTSIRTLKLGDTTYGFMQGKITVEDKDKAVAYLKTRTIPELKEVFHFCCDNNIPDVVKVILEMCDED